MYVDINIKMPLEYFGVSKEDLIDLKHPRCHKTQSPSVKWAYFLFTICLQFRA